MIDIERIDLSVDLVRGERNRSGQLPGISIAYIPAEHAERITALDARIEAIRKHAPLIGGGAASLGLICMASFGWVAPGLAAVSVLACLLQAMARYRKGC